MPAISFNTIHSAFAHEAWYPDDDAVTNETEGTRPSATSESQ